MRARHRGLHGRGHIDKQRRNAVLMIRTAQVRVSVWAIMMMAYSLPFSRHVYNAVGFVTELSLLALLLTDWGQMAASKSELAALDAHHDAEAGRVATRVDFRQLDLDVSRLAELQPGPDAEALAAEIRARFLKSSESPG